MTVLFQILEGGGTTYSTGDLSRTACIELYAVH